MRYTGKIPTKIYTLIVLKIYTLYYFNVPTSKYYIVINILRINYGYILICESKYCYYYQFPLSIMVCYLSKLFLGFLGLLPINIISVFNTKFMLTNEI